MARTRCWFVIRSGDTSCRVYRLLDDLLEHASGQRLNIQQKKAPDGAFLSKIKRPSAERVIQ
jgi:hypothetical protein